MTTFELFFDLVYVFAFTQVSQLMAHQHSALGILQGLVVLALLWWTWVGYGWLANRASADQPFLRIGMTAAMIAIFLAAQSIPEAYDDLDGGWTGPLVFALAYTAVRVVHIIFYTVAAGEDRGLRRQIFVMSSIATVPASALIIIGAVVGGAEQVWIWLAAMLWDAVATRVTARGGGGWRIESASHWSERHGLIVILALGESIVAIGVGVSDEPIGPAIAAGSAVAVIISMLLWWSYFGRLAEAGERELSRRTGSAQVVLATDAYSYVHFAIVAGIVLAALGVEDAMAHIAEAEPFGWFGATALGSGVAVFAAGTVWFGVRVGVRPYVRGVEAVALLVAIPVLASIPPMGALAVVAAVMGVLAVVESLIHRRIDAESPDGKPHPASER